ncbi:polysaccharide pyruvyl transferase family protein [Streptomyces sp. NRRL F-5123]|uniref:polysaccharide pyruvyl transferase family protein n=1 Tax=Streptomyces sp. NRRL F-5123 TaxID=1463856 RepID=UPI0004E1FB84|nr:polysaccharide pyruvyl transferase family protein [Streptomyces sp. NRRL F-5123]
MSTSSVERADVHSAAAITGKRRVAFAAYADARRLPGVLALLRSLALSNPGVCEDFVLLHDPVLPDASWQEVRALHPRVVPRPTVVGAHPLLAVLEVDDYDSVVAFCADTVVTGPLAPLLALRSASAATAAPGALVLQREDLMSLRAALPSTRPGHGSSPTQGGSSALTGPPAGGGPVAQFSPGVSPGRHPHAPLRGTTHPDDEALSLVRSVLELAEIDGGGLAHLSEVEAGPSAEEVREAYLKAPGVTHPDLLVHFGEPYVRRTGDVGTARRVAAAHIGAGRYQEAVDTMASVRLGIGDAWPHEVYGHALMSVSRYAEARTHLLAATAAPDHAAPAFARLAQIAWVLGDDAEAHRHALAGLDADPTHGPCEEMRQRTAASRAAEGGGEPGGAGKPGRPGQPGEPGGAAEPSGAGKPGGAGEPSGAGKPAEPGAQLTHVAFYMPHQGNAGDKLLPESVRLAFGPDTGPRRWNAVHAHRLFDEAALKEANSRRALVVGGGGLFIPDTAPNGNSAWQWNVPDDVLRRIDVPVIVYAVGFNAFDGQSYRARRFAEALRTLVEKSAFFGLRNHGSIEKVRAMLPAHLHERVRFQPCPTTVTRHLVPGWTDPAEREDTVLLNAAYDRAGLRFGHDYGHFLAETAAAVRAIGEHAEVRCVAHAQADERFVLDLRREHGISLPVVPMYDYDNLRITDAYARTRLVIGMRGHAGMIPFGCGTPIVSLVSHPKMAYFLADIDRPEWGVSVHHPHLGAVLAEKSRAILAGHEAAVADVHDRQRALWEVTRSNAEELRRLVE